MLRLEYDNWLSVAYWTVCLSTSFEYLGIVPFSYSWWIFMLPSLWLIRKGVDSLYDYLRGDLLWK